MGNSIRRVEPIVPKVVILTTTENVEISKGVPPTVPEEISTRTKPMRIKISDTIPFKGNTPCQPLIPTGPIEPEEKHVFKVLPDENDEKVGSKLNYLA